jgi:hypothetical protein
MEAIEKQWKYSLHTLTLKQLNEQFTTWSTMPKLLKTPEIAERQVILSDVILKRRRRLQDSISNLK